MEKRPKLLKNNYTKIKQKKKKKHKQTKLLTQ